MEYVEGNMSPHPRQLKILANLKSIPDRIFMVLK